MQGGSWCIKTGIGLTWDLIEEALEECQLPSQSFEKAKMEKVST